MLQPGPWLIRTTVEKMDIVLTEWLIQRPHAANEEKEERSGYMRRRIVNRGPDDRPSDLAHGLPDQGTGLMLRRRHVVSLQ